LGSINRTLVITEALGPQKKQPRTEAQKNADQKRENELKALIDSGLATDHNWDEFMEINNED
jgi:hypothetical protein